MKRRRLNQLAVAALAALGLSVATVGYTSRSATPPATEPTPSAITNAAPIQVIAPARVSLPTVPAEVLRMSEAGISDDVITSYIQNAASTYMLEANQIVYLRDVGVSSAVLNALVTHSQAAASGQAAEAASGATSAQTAFSQETPSATAPSTAPVNGPADGYYDALAPYGTWLDLPAYGWCWQPTVVVVNPAWQPYCNEGSWLWTDCGWYWNSNYAWGWAPFHYGRWCRHPGYGWLWCPDRVWGPAWVSWRHYPGYCGWAPLPPGACFTAGRGWTFNGVAVGFDFGFGLGPNWFTFCDYANFSGRHPFEHFRHGHDADRFFHESTVNNDFAADPHHGIINRGVDPARIEAVTHTPIRQVAVRELPRAAGRAGDFTVPDRLARNGNSPVIYRPGQNIAVPRNPFLPGRDTPLASRPGGFAATRGFTGARVVDNTPRFQPARPNGPQRSAPGASWNFPQRSAVNPHWGGAGNVPVTRSVAAPGHQPAYSYSRSSAPVRHSAPSYAGRPAPSYGSPAPAFGGGHAPGGGAQLNGGTHFGGGGANWGGGMASGGGPRR